MYVCGHVLFLGGGATNLSFLSRVLLLLLLVSLLLTLSCLFGFVVRAEILAFLDPASSNTG